MSDQTHASPSEHAAGSGVVSRDLLAELRQQLLDGDYGLIQLSAGDKEIVAVEHAIALRDTVREYLKLSSIDGRTERQALRAKLATFLPNVTREPSRPTEEPQQ